MADRDSARRPHDDARGTKRDREPSPPPPSPPRKRKRPTGGARINRNQIEDAQKREAERDQAAQGTGQGQASVSEFVTQHYNSVVQRGREWRRTDSVIKGLRSYNNWVKSVLIIKHAPKEAGFKILDVGCGKGGDLMKWKQQNPSLYVGLDPADVSIEQAAGRYQEMKQKSRGRLFHAEFGVKDCFGESLKDIKIVREVGFDEGGDARWGGGGFDVVSMMFCMHYAFESEEKARTMLRNVAGSLKKGGKFLGVIPNSDIISARVQEYHKAKGSVPVEGQANTADDEDDERPTFADSDDEWDPEKPIEAPNEVPSAPNEESTSNSSQKDHSNSEDPAKSPKPTKEEDAPIPLEWSNSIYKVQFPGPTPLDGVFRPPFGWKYFFFLAEAVDTVPEYVVPWESFRALAEDFNLELQYRKDFRDVWEDAKGDREMETLAERMHVQSRNGNLLVEEEEMEAAGFYHAFCFYKV